MAGYTCARRTAGADAICPVTLPKALGNQEKVRHVPAR